MARKTSLKLAATGGLAYAFPDLFHYLKDLGPKKCHVILHGQEYVGKARGRINQWALKNEKVNEWGQLMSECMHH